MECESWIKPQLLFAAAAAALVLCTHVVLAVEQTSGPFSFGSQAKGVAPLTSSPTAEGAPRRMGMSGGTAPSPRISLPGNPNVVVSSSPGTKPAKNSLSIGASSSWKSEEPFPAALPRSEESGNPKTAVTSSPSAKSQTNLLTVGTAYHGNRVLSQNEESGAASPQASAFTVKNNGVVMSSFPEHVAASPSSGHEGDKNTLKVPADSKFQHLTPEALKAFCEQEESSARATVAEEILNLTCTSKDCDTSGEEHTQAKSATMEEVCRLPSPEAAVDSDAAAGEAIRRHAKRQMEEVFSAAVKGKIVVAIGIPSNLPSIAELADQVVVVEMDRPTCDNFLTSKSGICTLRKQVQLVCMKLNNMTPEERAEATFETAEKLIKRHFYNIPADVVYISSDYPVAAAIKLYEEVDQSTTIIIDHRLSYLALQTLVPRFRQELLVPPNAMDEKLASLFHFRALFGGSAFVLQSLSFVLLRRSFARRPPAEEWRKYVAPHWRLSASDDALKRLMTFNEVVLELVKATGKTSAERNMRLYARTLRQFWIFASDQERAQVSRVIETIAAALELPHPPVTKLEDFYRHSAQRIVDYVRQRSQLKFYLSRLEAKIKDAAPSIRSFLEALFGDLIVALRKIESADKQRRAFKQLLRDVDAAVSRDAAQLPRLLHTVRMAIETFNDVKDSRAILRDTQQSCSLPSSKWQA